MGTDFESYECIPATQMTMGNTIPTGTKASSNDDSDANAISEVPPDTMGFYFNVFLIHKASGGGVLLST